MKDFARNTNNNHPLVVLTHDLTDWWGSFNFPSSNYCIAPCLRKTLVRKHPFLHLRCGSSREKQFFEINQEVGCLIPCPSIETVRHLQWNRVRFQKLASIEFLEGLWNSRSPQALIGLRVCTVLTVLLLKYGNNNIWEVLLVWRLTSFHFPLGKKQKTRRSCFVSSIDTMKRVINRITHLSEKRNQSSKNNRLAESSTCSAGWNT